MEPHDMTKKATKKKDRKKTRKKSAMEKTTTRHDKPHKGGREKKDEEKKAL